MRSILRNFYVAVFGTLKKPRAGIHIINSHYVTPFECDLKRDTKIFEDYLAYLSKTATFITVEEATKRIITNNIPADKTLIAFTFDDGFEECYSIIAPLLEKYNCRGSFFINANYIESDAEYQKEFNKRIATYTKKPMNWAQILDLHQRGHLIGSHNLDHTNFGEISLNAIEDQLKKNKQILEEKLKYNCDYFAWTYGQLHHLPIEGLLLTQKYHRYIFSGTNFKDYFSFDGRVINRRHQEANWPKSHIKYFVSFKKIFNKDKQTV